LNQGRPFRPEEEDALNIQNHRAPEIGAADFHRGLLGNITPTLSQPSKERKGLLPVGERQWEEGLAKPRYRGGKKAPKGARRIAPAKGVDAEVNFLAENWPVSCFLKNRKEQGLGSWAGGKWGSEDAAPAHAEGDKKVREKWTGTILEEGLIKGGNQMGAKK